MRPLHTAADVLLRDDRVVTVRWRDPGGRPRSESIVRRIDDWDYVGRWWSTEVRRHYLLLEAADGRCLEIYRQDGRWWVSRANA